MARDGREGAASEVTEQFSETTLNQFPHYAMAPNQFPHFNSGFGDGSSSESQLDLQRKLIEHQIEVLSFDCSTASQYCFTHLKVLKLLPATN